MSHIKIASSANSRCGLLSADEQLQLFMFSFRKLIFHAAVCLQLEAKADFNCTIFNDDRLGQVLNVDAVRYYCWRNQLASSFPASEAGDKRKSTPSANIKVVINWQLLI